MSEQLSNSLSEKGYMSLSQIAQVKGVAESDIALVIKTGEEYKITFFDVIKENDIYYFSPSDALRFDEIMDDFDVFYREHVNKDDEIEPDRYGILNKDNAENNTKNKTTDAESVYNQSNQETDNEFQSFLNNNSTRTKYYRKFERHRKKYQTYQEKINRLNTAINDRSVLVNPNPNVQSHQSKEGSVEISENSNPNTQGHRSKGNSVKNNNIDSYRHSSTQSFNNSDFAPTSHNPVNSDNHSKNKTHSPISSTKATDTFKNESSSRQNKDSKSEFSSVPVDDYMKKAVEFEEYKTEYEKIKANNEWIEKTRKQCNEDLNRFKNQVVNSNEVTRGVNYTADASKDYNQEKVNEQHAEQIDKINADTANIIAQKSDQEKTYTEYSDGSYEFKNKYGTIKYDATTGILEENYNNCEIVTNGCAQTITYDNNTYTQDIGTQEVSFNSNGDTINFKNDGEFSVSTTDGIINYDNNGFFQNASVNIDGDKLSIDKNGNLSVEEHKSQSIDGNKSNFVQEATKIDIAVGTSAGLHRYLREVSKVCGSDRTKAMLQSFNDYKNQRSQNEVIQLKKNRKSNKIDSPRDKIDSPRVKITNKNFKLRKEKKITEQQAIMNLHRNKRLSLKAAERMTKQFTRSLVNGSDSHSGYRQFKDITNVFFSFTHYGVTTGWNYDKKRVFMKRICRGDLNFALNVLKADGLIGTNTGSHKFNLKQFNKDFNHNVKMYCKKHGLDDITMMSNKDIKKFLKKSGLDHDEKFNALAKAVMTKNKYSVDNRFRTKIKRRLAVGGAIWRRLQQVASGSDVIQGYMMIEKVVKSTNAVRKNLVELLKKIKISRIKHRSKKLKKIKEKHMGDLSARQKKFLEKHNKKVAKGKEKVQKKQKKNKKKHDRRRKIRKRFYQNTRIGRRIISNKKLINKFKKSKFGKGLSKTFHIIGTPFRFLKNVFGFLSKGFGLLQQLKQIIFTYLIKIGVIILGVYLLLNIILSIMTAIISTFFPFLAKEDDKYEKYRNVVEAVEKADKKWYTEIEKTALIMPSDFVKDNDKDESSIMGYYDLNTESKNVISEWGKSETSESRGINGFNVTIQNQKGQNIEKICNAETIVNMGYIYSLEVGTDKAKKEINEKTKKLQKEKDEYIKQLKNGYDGHLQISKDLTDEEIEKKVNERFKSDEEDIDELKKKLNDNDALIDEDTLEDISLALHEYTHYTTSEIGKIYNCNGCKTYDYECNDDEIKQLNSELKKNDAHVSDSDIKTDATDSKSGKKTLLYYNKKGCSTSTHVIQDGKALSKIKSSVTGETSDGPASEIKLIDAVGNTLNKKTYPGACVSFGGKKTYLTEVKGEKCQFEIPDSCNDYKIVYDGSNIVYEDYSINSWFNNGQITDYNKVPAFGFKYGPGYVGTVQYLLNNNVVNNINTFTFTVNNGSKTQRIGSSGNSDNSVCKFDDVFCSAVLVGEQTNNGIEYRAITSADTNIINKLNESSIIDTSPSFAFVNDSAAYNYCSFLYVEMDKGTFVCNGHNSCSGHTASYCTGHVNLNITGHVIDEVIDENNNVCTYIANHEDYDKEEFDIEKVFVQQDWSSRIGHLQSLLENDWKDTYGFSIRKTWSSSISNEADYALINKYYSDALIYGVRESTRTMWFKTEYELSEKRKAFIKEILTLYKDSSTEKKKVFEYDESQKTYTSTNNYPKKISSQAFINYLHDRFSDKKGVSFVNIPPLEIQAGDIVSRDGVDDYAIVLYKIEDSNTYVLLGVRPLPMSNDSQTGISIFHATIANRGSLIDGLYDVVYKYEDFDEAVEKTD